MVNFDKVIDWLQQYKGFRLNDGLIDEFVKFYQDGGLN